MSKKVFIIEYAKANDKGFDGFRSDTKPILNAVMNIGFLESEVVFYEKDKKDELFEYLKQNALHVISRINPGHLQNIDEYFNFLSSLSDVGVKIYTHPNVVKNLNFKDILYKLKDSILGEKSTRFYKTYEEFKQEFKQILIQEKQRVLKTNFGSMGKGVYLVTLEEGGIVKSVHAFDESVKKYENIDNFIDEFKQNFIFENTLKNKYGFVSCKYQKDISQGEISVFFIKQNPICIVHKKIQPEHFSSKLALGAKYTYESIEDVKYKKVLEFAKEAILILKPYLEGFEYPLLWNLEFIKSGENSYILNEINCSCVDLEGQIQNANHVALALSEV